MVLKRLALLFLISLVVTAFPLEAKTVVTREQKVAFTKAKQLYKDKLFQQSIDMLNSKFKFNSTQTPAAALILAAYSYEKLEDYQASLKIYYTLIKRQFKGINANIIQKYKTSGTDDLPEASQKLYSYYHKIAESMMHLYLKNYEKLSDKEREGLRKRATMYVEILGESEYKNDTYDSITEKFEKHDKYLADIVYNSQWFFSASFISYRNELSITREADGFNIPINTTVEGLCLGGGWRYQNAFWEYNIQGCYSAATMNVDTDAAVTYQQSGVASTTLMLGPSVLWKPKSGDVSIGIHIPFIYNTGDYTVPNNYTINDQTLVTFGYFLETNWKLSNWGIFTKFGKAAQFNSSLWLFGINFGL